MVAVAIVVSVSAIVGVVAVIFIFNWDRIGVYLDNHQPYTIADVELVASENPMLMISSLPNSSDMVDAEETLVDESSEAPEF